MALILLILVAKIIGGLTVRGDACMPPESCKVGIIHEINKLWTESVFSDNDLKGLDCQVTASSRIVFNRSQTANCDKANLTWIVQIKPRRRLDPQFILDKRLNLNDVVEYISMKHTGISLQFENIRKIGIDLGIDVHREKEINYQSILGNVFFEFYTPNGKLIKSCADFNGSKINSIFQLPSWDERDFRILNCIYRIPLCPWVFNNSLIYNFVPSGLSNTYFKRNMLRFTNESIDFSDIHSNIVNVHLRRTIDISLDVNLINPHVFRTTQTIYIYQSVIAIGPDFLRNFPSLAFIHIEGEYFRKINHRQGIEWIKARNSRIKVNYTEPSDLIKNGGPLFRIKVRMRRGLEIKDIFPDEDFCLYQIYPFHQLIFISFLSETINGIEILEIDLNHWEQRTCTVEHLTRNFRAINEVLLGKYDIQNLSDILDPKNYRCDHDALLKRCNKAEYYRKHFWIATDWEFFGKNLKVVFTILTYMFSLFGIVTNLIVVIIIVRKENSEIFKGFKQYKYLNAISLINIGILTIQLLSWMSDCKETLDVFCPETRRFIPVQFFKIIFKEAAVPALRFMSNFFYVAFAFNRISLIGKNHSKITIFFTKTRFKRYLITTGLISIILSVVKVFKYKVNYDHSEAEYPISNETDLFFSSSMKCLYFVINAICDLFNYLVFVLVNLTIDVYMLVRLRVTIDEKLKRLANMNSVSSKEESSPNKKNEHKTTNKSKSDMENAKNNAIRMVVFNSLFNFLFKIPLVIIPLINTICIFYLKSLNKTPNGPGPVIIFYFSLTIHGSFHIIPDVADFFYTVLIACQLFIYRKFDTKIRIGFEKFIKRSNH